MNVSLCLRTITPFAVLALTAAAFAETQYEIINIGTLPGSDYGSVAAINNNNRVVGTSHAGSTTRAFQWQSGFGLNEVHAFGFNSTAAYDINDNNFIAGYMDDDGFERGFTYINGGWFYNNAVDGTSGAVTRGINNLNQSVGFSNWGDDSRATGWLLGSPGFALPNHNPPQFSGAFRINDSGESVGQAKFNDTIRATLFHNNNSILDLHEFLPQGSTFSRAVDISNGGWIIGNYRDASNKYRGFYFNFEVGMQYLEDANSDLTLSGMSDTGIIVGGNSNSRAMVWKSDTGLVDMNTLIDPNSGWTLIDAVDVNDAGWITGQGVYNGIYTSFVARPTEAVPEPATLIVLGFGIATFAKRRKKS